MLLAGAGTGSANPEVVGGQTWPPFNVILVGSSCLEGWVLGGNGGAEVGGLGEPAWGCCEDVVGVEGGDDKLEVLVSSSLPGTVGPPDGKRLHGETFSGGRKLSCELCFEGEKDSVRLASTDKFSAVDSINWFIPWIWAAKDEKAFRVGVSWNAFLRIDIWAFSASSCPRKPGHCWKNNSASGWDKTRSRLMMPESGKCSCIALIAYKSRVYQQNFKALLSWLHTLQKNGRRRCKSSKKLIVPWSWQPPARSLANTSSQKGKICFWSPSGTFTSAQGTKYVSPTGNPANATTA